MLEWWDLLATHLSAVAAIGIILSVVTYVAASFLSGLVKSDHDLVKALKYTNDLLVLQNSRLRDTKIELQRQLNMQAYEIKRLQWVHQMEVNQLSNGHTPPPPEPDLNISPEQKMEEAKDVLDQLLSTAAPKDQAYTISPQAIENDGLPSLETFLK
jgi:hypothetical protein